MDKDQIIKSTVNSIHSVSLLSKIVENQNNDKASTAYYNVKPDTKASSAVEYKFFITFRIYSSTQ